MFSFFKEFFNSENYVMQREPPPIKWLIDIVPCGTVVKDGGVEEYVVKRLDPKQNFVHYEVIAFFKTAEEAEAFVGKHFHFPIGYRYSPTIFEDPEVKS